MGAALQHGNKWLLLQGELVGAWLLVRIGCVCSIDMCIQQAALQHTQRQRLRAGAGAGAGAATARVCHTARGVSTSSERHHRRWEVEPSPSVRQGSMYVRWVPWEHSWQVQISCDSTTWDDFNTLGAWRGIPWQLC